MDVRSGRPVGEIGGPKVEGEFDRCGTLSAVVPPVQTSRLRSCVGAFHVVRQCAQAVEPAMKAFRQDLLWCSLSSHFKA